MNDSTSILIIDDVNSIVQGLERKLLTTSKDYAFKQYIVDIKKDVSDIINEIVQLINENNITHIISDRSFALIDSNNEIIIRRGDSLRVDDVILKVIDLLDKEVIQKIKTFIIYTYDPYTSSIRRDLRVLRKDIVKAVSSKTNVSEYLIYSGIRTIETSSIYRRPGATGIYPQGFKNDCIVGTVETCEIYGEFLADVLLDMIEYNENLDDMLNPYSYCKRGNYEILKFIRSFEDLFAPNAIKVGSISCYGNVYEKEQYLVDAPFKAYYERINQNIEEEGINSIFYTDEEERTDFVSIRWICYKYEVYEDDQLFLIQWEIGKDDSIEFKTILKWLPLLHSAIFYCNESSWQKGLLRIKPKKEPISTVTIFFTISNINEDDFKGTFNFTLFSEDINHNICEFNLFKFENYAHLFEAKLLELILPYKSKEVIKQARKAAISQVLARNMSHNHGSHVLSRMIHENQIEDMLGRHEVIRFILSKKNIK